MDPTLTAAGLAPWAQMGILGSVVIALAGTVVLLWRQLDRRTESHLQAVQRCHDQTLDITVRKIESDNKLAHALDGLERVVETALDALKERPR